MLIESEIEYTVRIDSAILNTLERNGTCSLSTLREAIPGYTWNYMLAAIDRLSRQDQLVVKRYSRFDYHISLVSYARLPASQHPVQPKEEQVSR